MKQQIQAGGVFDFLTKDELIQEMGHKVDQTVRDWARGVKLIRFRSAVQTDASGNFTDLIPGPESGYVWDIKRMSVFGSAYSATVNSSSASGSVTSGAAGATIAQIPLPIGTYQVQWTVGLSGTVGAPELNNFSLFQSGTGSNFEILHSENAAAVGTYPQQTANIKSTNANNFIKILIGSNTPTVGSVYAGQLTVTPTNSGDTNTALYRGGSSLDTDPGHFVSFLQSEIGSEQFGSVAAMFPKLAVTYVGGENLIVVGSSLVASSSAFISGQALEVPAEMIAKLV